MSFSSITGIVSGSGTISGDLNVQGEVQLSDAIIDLNAERNVLVTGGIHVLKAGAGHGALEFDGTKWVAGTNVLTEDIILTSGLTGINTSISTLGGDITNLQTATTSANIKIAYESNADTNSLSDSEKAVMGLILQASSQDKPLLISNLDNATPSYNRSCIATIGTRTYSFVSASGGGILIYDITDPHAPIYWAGATGTPVYTIADLDPGGVHAEAIVNGNYLYSCASAQGLDVFDITNIETGGIPISTNPIATAASFDGIAQAASDSSRIAVAGGSQGVLFLNTTSPAVPSTYAIIDLGGGYTSICMNSAGTILVANYGTGINIINSTTWASPSVITSVAIAGSAKGCYYHNATNTIYLCRASSGLFAYDVSTPASPVLIASYSMNCNDVYANDTYVYVCQQGGVILVLDLTLTLVNTAVATDPNGITSFENGDYLSLSDGTGGYSIYSLIGGIETSGNVIVGGVLEAHSLRERETGEGVSVEGVLMRDGLVDGEDVAGLGTRLTTAEGDINAIESAYLPLTGGSLTGAITNTSTISGSSILASTFGSAGAPNITFSLDALTGMFLGGTSTLSLTCGGVQRLQITPTEITSSVTILGPTMGTGVPTFSFLSDTNSGISNPAPDQIGVITGGTLRLTVSNTSLSTTIPIRLPSGSVLSPSYSFSLDPNSGIYSGGADVLGFSTGGVQRVTMTSTGLAASGDVSGATLSLSSGQEIAAFGTGFGFYDSSAALLFYATTSTPTTNATSAFLSNLMVYGHCHPQSDGAYTCGKSGQRWSAIHAANGTIQTSDVRMKNTIVDSPLGLDFVNDLRPVSYKWNPTITDDGTIVHTRTHMGLIAQEVQAAIVAHGETLDSVDIVDNDFLVGGDLDRYGIRYATLIPVLIKSVQELTAKNALLEARITALEIV